VSWRLGEARLEGAQSLRKLGPDRIPAPGGASLVGRGIDDDSDFQALSPRNLVADRNWQQAILDWFVA
jgi:hypothetical protein